MPILVDLDGTLFDTLDAHYSSYKEVLADYGFILHKELFRQKCFGKASFAFLRELGFDAKVCNEIIWKKRASFPSHLYKVVIHVDLHDYIQRMRGQEYIALFTNAQRETIDLLLSQFGVSNLFNSIYSIEDFLNSKPSQESFEFVLKRIPNGEVFLIDDMQENLLQCKNFGIIPIDITQIVKGFSLTQLEH